MCNLLPNLSLVCALQIGNVHSAENTKIDLGESVEGE